MSSPTLSVSCSGCDRKLRVPETARGKQFRCPMCKHLLSIPKVRDDASSAPKPRNVVSTPTALPKPRPVAKPIENDFDDLTFPTPQAHFQPQPLSYSQPSGSTRWASQSKRQSLAWLYWLIGFIAIGGVGVILVLGWFVIGLLKDIGNQPFAANSSETIPTGPVTPAESKNVSSPVYPPLPSPSKVVGIEGNVYNVRFSGPSMQSMQARIYMPAGTHQPATLGCVFTAPAGTPLLHGVKIGQQDNMEEILPYVNAGFVVTIFDLDGDMPEGLSPEVGQPYFQALSSAYDRFVKADAGVLNGKLAIDYVLARVPEVDPKKLYSSGHSSAATLSLLLAAKDKRISKCIAFAPITDLNSRIGDIATDPSAKVWFKNFRGYCRTGSPITYASIFRCPIFILHAMDDENEPFASSERFVRKLNGQSVTFVQERRGGHYAPMVNVGLPKAIKWLNE